LATGRPGRPLGLGRLRGRPPGPPGPTVRSGRPRRRQKCRGRSAGHRSL